jgi:hypothetical protein
MSEMSRTVEMRTVFFLYSVGQPWWRAQLLETVLNPAGSMIPVIPKQDH